MNEWQSKLYNVVKINSERTREDALRELKTVMAEYKEAQQLFLQIGSSLEIFNKLMKEIDEFLRKEKSENELSLESVIGCANAAKNHLGLIQRDLKRLAKEIKVLED